MKRLFAYLGRRALAASFVAALSALLAALLLSEWLPRQGPFLHAICLFLFAGALVVLLVIAWRLARFYHHLFTLLRQLVAGDYEVGMPVRFRWRDEVSTLAGLVNKLVEQLRTYDELRIRRIRQLRMTLDLVIEHSGEPMMLYDAEKGALECNSAMLGVPETAKQTVLLSALQKLESNKEFIDMLLAAVEREKSPQQGRVAVHFPAQESSRNINLRIVPLKDKDEAVPFAIVLATSSEARADSD